MPEAFQASDVDKARKALERMRKSMTRLAKETGNETTPEFRKLSEQLKNAEARMDELGEQADQTGDSLEELNDKANDGADSLKRIEALEVAAALRESVESARAAGRSFAALGDDSKGAGEKILEATTAASAFAAASRAAHAALGPWGIALVAITTAIQLAVELMEKHTKIVTDNSEKEIRALKKTREAAEEKRKENKKALDSAKEFGAYLKNLKEAADDEKRAIDAQTESLKKQMALREEITQKQIDGAKAVVQSKLVSGDITEAQAEKQLKALDQLQKDSARKHEEDLLLLEITEIENEIARKESDLVQIKKQRREIAKEAQAQAEDYQAQATSKSEEYETGLSTALKKIGGLDNVEFEDKDFTSNPLKKLEDLEDSINEQIQSYGGFTSLSSSARDEFTQDREVIDEARSIIVAALAAKEEAEQLTKYATRSDNQATRAEASFDGRESSLRQGLKSDRSALSEKKEDFKIYEKRTAAEDAETNLQAAIAEQNKTLEKSAEQYENLIDQVRSGTDEIEETSARNESEFEAIKTQNEAALETLGKVLEDGQVNNDEIRAFADALATLKKNSSGTNQRVLSILRTISTNERITAQKLAQIEAQVGSHEAILQAQ